MFRAEGLNATTAIANGSPDAIVRVAAGASDDNILTEDVRHNDVGDIDQGFDASINQIGEDFKFGAVPSRRKFDNSFPPGRLAEIN